MKILIDTTPLLKKLTGIGQVTYIYAKELQKYDHEYVYFYAWFYSKELKEKPLGGIETHIKTIKRFIPRPYFVVHTVKTLIFNFIIFFQKPDVFFQPNYISFKMFKKVPTVTMVHDLSHILYPEYHPKERVEYLDKELKKSLDTSDKIIAISNATKDDLIKYNLADAKKIEVIYNGVSSSFKPLHQHDKSDEILKKYDLKVKSYFLFVGTLEPRKNLQLLLKSYMLYIQKVQDPTPLILVGGGGWKSEVFDELLQEALNSLHVKALGFVKDEELAVLYAGAKVFVYPSVYEGFGLPPLEAMASQTAVITSNVSSLPEVVEDAGMLIDPLDEEKLLEAMMLLDTHDELRNSYEQKGLIQAKKFSWDRSVDRLRKLFEDL